MRTRVMMRVVGAVLLVGAMIGGCATQAAPGTGSETNWARYCDEDRPCASGECLCGHCLEPCGGQNSCENTVCAEPGTIAHQQFCGDSAAPGLCVGDCVDVADCGFGFRCDAGFCVPEPLPPPQGTTQQLWSGACGDGAPCLTGECVCGACLATCEQAGQCAGGLHCALAGHPSHTQLCGSGSDAPGVCLPQCGENGLCDAGSVCYEGLCTPAHPAAAPVGAFCERDGASLFRHIPYFRLEESHFATDTTVCESGFCMVDGFQGHPSCPYGSADPLCAGEDVPPQLVSRPPEDAIYCSCRCDGPPELAPFCVCPEGLECDYPVSFEGPNSQTGMYCVKPTTIVDDYEALREAGVCDPELGNCDDR